MGREAVASHAEWEACVDGVALDSTIETDELGGEGLLEPSTTYENFKWIVVRNANGQWEYKEYRCE